MRQEVSGMRQEVSGMRQEVSGMRQEVSGMRLEVSGMRQEVSGIGLDSIYCNCLSTGTEATKWQERMKDYSIT